jgi:hypothetical protein
MHRIDPDSLPEVAGTLERFVLNPHGEVDGFVMNSQTQTPILVHTPPHMEGELTGNVKTGDKIRVRPSRDAGKTTRRALKTRPRRRRRRRQLDRG